MARVIVNSLILNNIIIACAFFVKYSAKYDVNKSTKVFIITLEGADSRYYAPPSISVDTIGKHYLIRSFNRPNVRRHYTISSCMKQDTYKEYVRAIEQFKGGQQVQFDNSVLIENKPDNGKTEIIFTAKTYNILGGLSNTLHTADHNEVYQVKALMGKGLGLTKDGTYVAFVGGTGILVFVDLIALMLRLNLGLIDANSVPIFSAGSTFKFVLFASFANRTDGVALELLEGLKEITKQKGLDNFELNLRIKSEQTDKSRWDQDFIRRQIELRKKEGLKRAFVCGPPAMNELFDKTFDSLIAQQIIKPDMVEVM